MGVSRVPVDLLNPGQVFACLGLMEVTEILSGACEGAFAPEHGETRGEFALHASGSADPLEDVIRFLERATVRAVAPAGFGLAAKEDGVVTIEATDLTYPCPLPDSPSALPVVLGSDGMTAPIEYWADGSSRDNVKWWGGSGGRSGAALTSNLLDSVKQALSADRNGVREDPFNVQARMSSSYRLDWRRDYVPLDAGFSPNKHDSIEMIGYPFVEVLGAIGLQGARPRRASLSDALTYRYALPTAALPTPFARALLGGPFGVFHSRAFTLRLSRPSKHERCVVSVSEELLNE